MKKLALILVILLSGAAARAQAVLQPLQQDARQPHTNIVQKRQAAAAALSLPFFDDFAGATVKPDPDLWQQNGGVYINSRYAFAPVTKNVASFDGLDDFGQPYAPGSVAAGPSDTLTSKPIRLDDFSPSDSVYLSFYWQSGGLGDVPDKTVANLVYLQLEFKDDAGKWLPVWQQAGIGETSDFVQVFVGLKDKKFFHDSFQFRFRSVGVRNGLADVWNVDYVELDDNRHKGRNTTRDIAISEGISRLLEHYTAMPYRQFLKNPDEQLAEEVRATVNNLGGLPGAISWRGYIRQLHKTAADTFLRAEALVPAGARQYAVTGTPRVEKLNMPKSPFTLVHGVVLETKEQNARQRANDSTARETDFADYFAYDDGTAEAGFSFPGTGNTQVAQRFDLNLADQVKGFRVYFPRVNQDLSKTGLAFKVWADEDGMPGEVLYQQSFPIQYSDSLNAFYEITLNEPVAVSGSFYVGWSQPGNLYVNIGFDRNEVATGRRFLFTGYNNWQPDTVLAGAIMLRPVMAGEEALGIEEDLEAARIKVYPNPSSGNVYIDGEYQSLVLYDITGRQLYRHTYNGSAASLQLGSLPAGLYTLRITTKKATISKKLILTKP
ncbi:T9SS type A sorting domain-containing protein [Pontibacter sp. 172403-2]|uniref:T9SS type A sorting domain-containing protein n=1 Tax=Pontibacter rufus TaxID=2791028 RepID=UPI0018B006CB|nr:T9SS type A sorting domain-containing protein [Pontibacter sp. 172403-2]MBF9254240.1 T9SS type A sorting domain-containing protein [Pontibacter sp. 172403-2]